MSKKLKPLKVKTALIFLAASIAIACAVLFAWTSSGAHYLLPQKDIQTVDISEIKPGAVFSVESNNLLDSVAVNDYGRFYILDVGENSFMLLLVSPDNYALADEVNAATIKYILKPDESEIPEKCFTGKGMVIEMEREAEQRMYDWFRSVNFYGVNATQEEIRSHIYPYTLAVMTDTQYFKTIDYISLFGSIALILISLIALVIAIVGYARHKKKIAALVKSSQASSNAKNDE